MRTKIISAFPGTGKSYYHKKYPNETLDSDSSNFSWIKDEDGNNTKERNPNFPENYIEHIKSNVGKYKYIFVSSHKEVRDALLDSCIFFYIVYPEGSRKEEFLKRYKDRGNPEGFVKLVDENWNSWLAEIYWINEGCEKICMVLNNLEDELNHLESFEK
jgi:hypothetical protein